MARHAVPQQWRSGRIFPNVLRCYQEFRDELEAPMDLTRMLAGMEALRGARAGHACL
jgi:hypothetical protein